MFGGRKRPWKDYASIQRTELNSGDVKYRTKPTEHVPSAQYLQACVDIEKEFESLTEAEAHLDAWWADWWPKQTKKVSKA